MKADRVILFDPLRASISDMMLRMAWLLMVYLVTSSHKKAPDLSGAILNPRTTLCVALASRRTPVSFTAYL